MFLIAPPTRLWHLPDGRGGHSVWRITMYNKSHVLSRSLDSLKNEAAEKMNKKRAEIREWIKLIRDERTPYKFKWAVSTTRDANVNSTGAALAILKYFNLWDEFIDENIMRQGREWMESIHRGNGVFEDPAFFSRKPDGWDEKGLKWPPTSGHREVLNRGGLGLYKLYGGKMDLEEPPIPPEWPTLETIETSLDWIKETNNASWTAKVILSLIRWYRKGSTDDDMLLKCMRYVYEIQDPKTGMWHNDSIEASFKYLVELFFRYPLPFNYANEMLTWHMDKVYSPGYEPNGTNPCQEIDFWYNVGMIVKEEEYDYPTEDIIKTALWRIIHIIDYYSAPDGGLKAHLEGCQTTWMDWDISPRINQGGTVGTSGYGIAIIECAALAELHDKVSWNLQWVKPKAQDEEDLIPLSALEELIKTKLSDVINA